MAEHTAAPSQAQLEDSQSAIRATTRWLVAAAAAVGAVAVAGLQLSKLPHGTIATSMVFAGFALALVGVAWVLFSAASVLSVGYTNLNQLSELYNPEALRMAQVQILEDRIKEFRRENEEISSRPGRLPLRLIARRARNHIYIRILERREARIPLDKDNGVEIADMLDYLEKDTPMFTGFLAAKIPDLYRMIETTDKEILQLRGERAETQPEVATSRNADLFLRRRHPRTGPRPDAPALAEAEWRAAKLEAAAGQLIAFANQKVIENRFGALKNSVRYGGSLVIIGVAVFALAQKAATPSTLDITQPTKITIVVKDPSKFGSGCSQKQLSAVAIGGTWDKPIVVSTPSAGCTAAQLELSASIGYAIPVVTAPATSTP